MVDKTSLLINNLFLYDSDLDEWYKDIGDIRVIIWQNLNSSTEWSLSYVDNDDYLHSIITGDYDHIIYSLIIFERDIKISKLLTIE